VLGEEAGPVLPARRDFNTPYSVNPTDAHRCRWSDGFHGLAAFGKDEGVSLVKDDSEAVDAPTVERDASISEVKPQQVGVRDRF
jgi:hypothetical protein